jgi:hypothetical protein
MARNSAHSLSSASRWADPAAFQRAISSRKAPEVGPQSVESASPRASDDDLPPWRLRPRRRLADCWANCALRRRVYVVRAELKRCHRASSVARSIRGSAFHSSSSWPEPVDAAAPVVALRRASRPRRPSPPWRRRVASCCLARSALRASDASASFGAIASRRAASDARSPTALASVDRGTQRLDRVPGVVGCQCAGGEPLLQQSDLQVEASKRRTKKANASSALTSGTCPTTRSPSSVVT